jgi:cardiolipin synthase A/B
MRVARRGGKVQLILAGKSDVAMSQWACRRLYQKLLGAGVEIYEYAPQVLHAKLMLVDKVVYVGSANLDVRSLRINYELMLRLHDKALVAQGSRIFAEALQHSVRIEASTWRQYRSLWGKLKEMWAYFLLTRVDPYLSRRQLWRLS